MLSANHKGPTHRIIFVRVGAVFLGIGISALRRGDLFTYQTWWGGMGFGPFAIVFGILFILGAIFKPDIFKA
jgi:hypothetical protein